ncbi:LuxR C-terminal-related transcriptional regulator [Antricoccus suffuscus]|uniref:LuxR C-terminal-related transcriptional regulator n=1 Tax=Antricoccus suffuscus TaxID=1629062 RepID=UPI0014741E7D|nr:LuxR C-terminal-related transcriptional regulator [Antricoccus suffuscus]
MRAPTGFGKTVLLATWAASRSETEVVAWAHVDEDDRDPGAFWSRIRETLHDVGIGVPGAARTSESDRRHVQRAIQGANRPVTLILDGYDAAAEELDRALVDLLRQQPQLTLIISLRSHQRLPAGARVGLETVIIDAMDLLFSVAEVGVLLSARGAQVTEAHAAAVFQQTNGWPALVAALAEGATTDNLAADYVRSHLLPQIEAPELRRFLLIASIPRPLTADIMRLLTDDPAADGKLRQLESAGVLFATIEDGTAAYQIPSAMRVALGEELTARWPGLACDVHSRLARWHLTQQAPAEALRHAITAQDWGVVVEVINKFWGLLLGRDSELLYEAFMLTPLSEITGIRALACRDLMLRAPDDTFLAMAPTALPSTRAELEELGRSPDVRDALPTGLVVMMALRRRGLHREAREYSDRLEVLGRAARIARTNESLWQLPPMYTQTGTTRMLAGNFRDAIGHLQTSYHTAHESPLAIVAPDAAGRTALAWALLGDSNRAAIWLARHDAAPDPQDWFVPVVRSPGHGARALIAIDQLLPDAAREALDRIQDGPHPDESWPFLAYVRAQYALIWGDPIGQLNELDETRDRHRAWIGEGGIAAPMLASAEADLLTSLGWGNQARAIIDGPHASHPLMQVSRARLALLTGRSQDALMTGSSTTWTRNAPSKFQREMLLLHTVANLRLGEIDTAATMLRRAVRRARSAHALRAFATVPTEEIAVLADRVPEAVALLRHRLVRDTAPIYPDTIDVVTLTERETLVLNEVAGGQTMPQIAEALYVSYNTVKSQMRTLYQKLGAGSRPEALIRARALGLID